MKRIVVLTIVLSIILSGCGTSTQKTTSKQIETITNQEEVTIENKDYSSSTVLSDIENQVYKDAIETLDNNYYVQDVKAVYLSDEYLKEVNYNSQENIFFGYKLSDLDKEFAGKKYVFTLGSDGKTTVEVFKPYDDTNEKMIRNVAIGMGVILVCVTVCVVTGGAGAPVVATVFAASAKAAAVGAISGAVIDGTIGGVTTAIKTDGDKDEIVKSIKKDASEGFAVGAVTGAITGGISKAMSIKKATSAGLKAKNAVAIQKESKWSSETISNIRSMDEYRVLKGSKEVTINGKKALVKNVNLKYKSNLNGKFVTNAQRMKKGYAPIEPKTGKPYELHHVGQENDSALAVITNREHNKYYKVLHDNRKVSAIDRKRFRVVRKNFWKAYVKMVKK